MNSFFSKDKNMPQSLFDYLTEVELKNLTDIDRSFNKALAQVFSPEYFQSIQKIINKAITIKLVNKKNQNIVAYNVGNKIFINDWVFQNYDEKKKIQIILHEFMHLLQRKRKLFFFKEFKPLHDLTNNLYAIVKKNLVRPFSVFLTGKALDVGPGGKYEILAYLMQDSINWSALNESGKKEFIDELKRSRIFNLSHPFWKKRLT
jgi:hypothetical protein